MSRNILFSFAAILAFSLNGCGYSFTGASIPAGVETYQVNFFQNNAGTAPGSVFEPGLDRDFTIALQDLLQNQTNLELTNQNGDLVYEGEITEYRVSPMTATSQNTAAQNRLTISVNVRFFNTKKEEDDFEKRFSFFFDYPASTQLLDVRDEAHAEIFERITQDIFNDSLAKW